VTISGGTVLEKCIQDVQFNVSTPGDYNSKNTKIKNSIKITGYIDTDESTVVLYHWALLPATNSDCYKEIIVEQYKSGKLLRKVSFSKAFVVKYSESYSKDKGVGIFTLYVKQLYGQDVEFTSEDINNLVSNEMSGIIDKSEESIEIVQKVTTVPTPALSLTKKDSKISDKLEKIKESQDKSVFIGKLYGKDIVLDDIEMCEINYIKRTDEEREKLRREFDSIEREKFIKKLANEYEEELRKAGITDTELLKMKDGLLPNKDWQVHHKLPLDDGGTNDEYNLVLIKNHPYHKMITIYQNNIIAKQIEDKDEYLVEFPIPPGNIYPPETREDFENSIPKAESRKKKKKK